MVCFDLGISQRKNKKVKLVIHFQSRRSGSMINYVGWLVPLLPVSFFQAFWPVRRDSVVYTTFFANNCFAQKQILGTLLEPSGSPYYFFSRDKATI